MAVDISHPHAFHPHKHLRRTATAVMAGVFDVPPKRDVLTSLLNGVPVYKAVEQVEKKDESRVMWKRERKEKHREAKRQKLSAEQDSVHTASVFVTPNSLIASASTLAKQHPFTAPTWHSRPAIHIPATQRSLSVTPPPCTSPIQMHGSSPVSTPGPSISSSTSRTSSKRPHTPSDDEDYDIHTTSGSVALNQEEKPRKKRIAARKGWKGWVEGSPPPSEKLINLDATPVLRERRTRSGKHFAGIGPGRDEWVCKW